MPNETPYPEIDLSDAVAPAFKAGKGVLLLDPDMPDAALLVSIRQALSFGMPFVVAPARPDQTVNHAKLDEYHKL